MALPRNLYFVRGKLAELRRQQRKVLNMQLDLQVDATDRGKLNKAADEAVKLCDMLIEVFEENGCL